MPRHATVHYDERALHPDDPLVLRAQARMLLRQQEFADLYGPKGDPWAYVRDLVWTKDEAAARVARYPDRAYAELLTRRWQTESLLAIAKSRRMVVSWLFIALNTWLAATHPGSKIGFLARKEGKTEAEGSAELVKRADFILSSLPPVFPPRYYVPGTHTYSKCYIRLPNGSEILGLGAGADQARQLTFTSVFCDEMAYWDEAYETWTGLKPTITGGGRITLVSSAGPGVFKSIVHDQLQQ